MNIYRWDHAQGHDPERQGNCGAFLPVVQAKDEGKKCKAIIQHDGKSPAILSHRISKRFIRVGDGGEEYDRHGCK